MEASVEGGGAARGPAVRRNRAEAVGWARRRATCRPRAAEGFRRRSLANRRPKLKPSPPTVRTAVSIERCSSHRHGHRNPCARRGRLWLAGPLVCSTVDVVQPHRRIEGVGPHRSIYALQDSRGRNVRLDTRPLVRCAGTADRGTYDDSARTVTSREASGTSNVGTPIVGATTVSTTTRTGGSYHRSSNRTAPGTAARIVFGYDNQLDRYDRVPPAREP